MKSKSLFKDITVKSRLKITGEVINENTTKGNLLDIGCFDKSLKKELKTEINYRGIDYPEIDLEKDILPCSSKSFDYVSCLEVLEHLKNPENAIKEIKRVVKDDGIIFISLPNSNHIYTRIKILFGKPFDFPFTSQRFKHLHFPIIKQNIDFIKKHFKIFKIYHFGFPNKLAKIYPKIFSYFTIFVCKK